MNTYNSSQWIQNHKTDKMLLLCTYRQSTLCHCSQWVLMQKKIVKREKKKINHRPTTPYQFVCFCMWTQSIPTYLKYLTYSTMKYIQTWQENNKYILIRHKFKEMSSQPNSCYADGRVSLRGEKACGLRQPRCQHHLWQSCHHFVCLPACLPDSLVFLKWPNPMVIFKINNFFDDHIPKHFFKAM